MPIIENKMGTNPIVFVRKKESLYFEFQFVNVS